MRVISKTEKLLRNEQPINWARAAIAGVWGAALMMAFIDIFTMMGITPFSLERYIGSVLLRTPFGTHVWTIGYLANLVIGAIFGLFYAYFFEYEFQKTSPQLGFFLGLAHAVLAAVAFFPFFGMVRESMGIDYQSTFGFFGLALNSATPLILLVGHLLFGATVGVLYGPVRLERVHAREFEADEIPAPGDLGVPPYPEGW